MKKLVLCDFDGTISPWDIGYLLLNHFSQGDWESIDRDFSEGKIGSREAYIRVSKILKGKKEPILTFIRGHSNIDPHFVAFYRYCNENNIDIKIVSDGLDIYIKTILEINKLSQIHFYSNLTNFIEGDGISISFPYFNEDCGLCGTCKKSLVQMQRESYEKIFYVGNGISDYCASQEADFVFAKNPLYNQLNKNCIPCQYFSGFEEIVAKLKNNNDIF